MLKRFLASALVIAGASFASAQLQFHTLNNAGSWTASLSGGGLVAGFDVLHSSTTTPDDGWLAGGIYAATTYGTTFRRATPDGRAPDPVGDPNNPPRAYSVAPGTGADSRLTTFFSLPTASPTAAKRFDNTQIPGTTSGGDTWSDTFINNVNAFKPPPGGGGNGYWARVIVNLPAGIDPADVYVAPALQNPGDILIADGEIQWGSFLSGGVVVNPWVIAAVPEPASIALLALGALAAIRRR